MRLFKIVYIDPEKEETTEPVSYVGVYPLKWGKVDWPEVGFAESSFTTEGVGELLEAIDKALHELGVPQPGYPAPVANAYDILRVALDKYAIAD